MKRSYSAVLIHAMRTARKILDNPDTYNAITLARAMRISVKPVRSYLRLIETAYGIYPRYSCASHTFRYERTPAAVAALLRRF